MITAANGRPMPVVSPIIIATANSKPNPIRKPCHDMPLLLRAARITVNTCIDTVQNESP
jgi:hypothetical protein